MRFLVFFSFLFVAFFTAGYPSADAQKLKNVSPTKYESRAPARNYTFDWEMPLREYRAELGMMTFT